MVRRRLFIEKECIDALSSGDIAAYEKLYRHYYPRLVNFIACFVDTREESEDMTQEILIKLWQCRDSLRYVENLNGYLFKMAKNAVYDAHRISSKFDSVSLHDVGDIEFAENPAESYHAKELESLIELTIRKMPPQRQNIFMLSRHSNLSNAEIAERLNISKRTVETHISSALADIRKTISALSLFFL